MGNKPRPDFLRPLTPEELEQRTPLDPDEIRRVHREAQKAAQEAMQWWPRPEGYYR